MNADKNFQSSSPFVVFLIRVYLRSSAVKYLLLISILAKTASAQMPPSEPGVSHELAKWRAARYSGVRYKLNLTLEKMSPVLKGTMEIRVKVADPDTKAEPPALAGGFPVVLDWRKIRGSEQLSGISNVSINGVEVKNPPANAGGSASVLDGPRYEERDEHLIFRDSVKPGENVIKLDFTSPILTTGSAITRYIDKEDGNEYIYSLFVPSDASTAFPVFDQPDLKARFTLNITAPGSWGLVSNTGIRAQLLALCSPGLTRSRDAGTAISPAATSGCDPLTEFHETKPISTYVFAFAAGPWERVLEPPPPEPALGADIGSRLTTNFQRGLSAAVQERLSETGTLASSSQVAGKASFWGIRNPVAAPTGAEPLASSIYVRKSQLKKFQPHAAEVFRLNREGIKFLEQYFDYKFPFPKYDIVLIPEFPFGGMEHAGATFLRESSVIFPQAPTKNDYISRANVIFHEAAHQWFGDTVTMKWFDDLWLKEGFAEFMAYKTLEKVMPEYNAWKVFYERNKQAAYLTDSTKGTTPIYQEITNLNSAKSAYGNIVYRKAPSFLKQAEFYLGPDKFQRAVQAFLKKHEYANAGWGDLIKEFQNAAIDQLKKNGAYTGFSDEKKEAEVQRERENIYNWATIWVSQPGVPIIKATETDVFVDIFTGGSYKYRTCCMFTQELDGKRAWPMSLQTLTRRKGQKDQVLDDAFITDAGSAAFFSNALGSLPRVEQKDAPLPLLVFPNYQDHGYGIFLLDPKSRDYVLKNIQNEKDDFLRTMMWGSLWDSVREGELDPREYVELVVKNLKVETDESTIQTLLGRVSTAMRYYIEAAVEGEPPALAGGPRANPQGRMRTKKPPANAGGSALNTRLENLLIDRMQNASTPGQKITYYRSFLTVAASENARRILKQILKGSGPEAVATGSQGSQKQIVASANNPVATAPGSDRMSVTTKDKFDIVSRLIILGDPDAQKLLTDLEKTETSDEAKRYAYAAKAGFATAENKAKFWNDFVNNKEISESWIEAAFGPFNNVRHNELTLPYLERALKELPNHKRNRKIFFVNGWLAAFLGGQNSQQALDIVNKFLADNPNLDKDLRLKILENSDVIERAVKIRAKYGKKK
jgi:aminopeptidase N